MRGSTVCVRVQSRTNVVDLGVRPDHARQLVVDPVHQLREARPRPAAGEQEVVGRRPHRCGNGLAGVVGHHPEALLTEAVGMLEQRAGDPEDQVVARLVGEQQRGGGVEEGLRVDRAQNIHSSSSTTVAPPATRSPSATCTSCTTPA